MFVYLDRGGLSRLDRLRQLAIHLKTKKRSG